MAFPRLSAYVVAGLAVTQVVAGFALLTAAPDGGAAAYFAGAGALGLASVVLGVLVATRRPGNVVGLLLVLVGAVASGVAFGDVYTGVVERRPGLLPVSGLYVALSGGTWMFLYVPPALLMLSFPDGRLLPGRRWRWVAGGLLAVPVLFTLLVALNPNPYPPPFQGVSHPLRVPGGYEQIAAAAAIPLLPVLLVLLVASAAAMVVRFRRAPDDVRRAQLKWFALGAAFLPATLLLCWASYLLFDGPDLVVAGLAATFLAIPLATAIAMLKHDLYDVDRAISAAATYGLVTAGLLGFYTVASFVVGLGAGQASPVAVAAATAVCAAALAPLRSRLQRHADGRVTVQVRDDGLGGARMLPGAGLADRVAAAGGALHLSSSAGRGTLVEAVLPCAS
jgi:hypothetical protein